jgi:hypothetical protein
MSDSYYTTQGDSGGPPYDTAAGTLDTPMWYLPPVAASGGYGSFAPMQVWAGPAGSTSDDTIAQLGPIAAFAVLGRRADGKLVPLDPYSRDAAGTAVATGTITFSGAPAVNDTVTIGGTVVTFIANGATPVGNEIALAATPTAAGTAEQLYDFISANAAAFPTIQPTLQTDGGTAVEIEANTPGTGGNAITLAKSSTAITLSGATLSGGSTTTAEPAPESRPVAVLAAPIDSTLGDVQAPIYISGCFNYQILLWPPGVTTLLQMKQLLDATKMSCRALK